MIGGDNYVEYRSLPEHVQRQQPIRYIIYGTIELSQRVGRAAVELGNAAPTVPANNQVQVSLDLVVQIMQRDEFILANNSMIILQSCLTFEVGDVEKFAISIPSD
ncbi:hypothetical protein SAY86_014368 [Trapa natans]|uniref:Uncharacterized protein n=1 Tax=Trapa natans TaxID=22666 RepID=A0AAN7QQT6_TRANT|nr:hypothetical protein SAY86_014368 [Trapa natans]